MGYFVVDGHEDIAMVLLADERRDFARPAPPGQALSLPDLQRGQLGLVLATIFAPAGYAPGGTPRRIARRQLAVYDDLLDRHAEALFRVESRGDLELCRAGGPIGVIHLVEGADPIQSPDELSWWCDQGVRVVGIAWNTPNRYAGGAESDYGLTDAGRDLLDALGDLDMICDVSHLNRQGVEEVLLAAKGPVVASHSNAHAVYPHRRNLRDEHVRAIAELGGLVGVVLYGPFLRDGKAALGDVIDHIDHLVQIAGAEHVGLGSDLDGGFGTDQVPTGITTVGDLPRIGDALLERGYARKDVDAILGGNWTRILRESLPA